MRWWFVPQRAGDKPGKVKQGQILEGLVCQVKDTRLYLVSAGVCCKELQTEK